MRYFYSAGRKKTSSEKILYGIAEVDVDLESQAKRTNASPENPGSFCPGLLRIRRNPLLGGRGLRNCQSPHLKYVSPIGSFSLDCLD
ncbi:hypothetical protein TNCT_630121 [Trichonephila clavata]|uniref:Uncharacterized protein n=1 Tax=Trichonephila clavata TaxID=2740835 RepID=A0A8X6LHW4_TRICU|nr:hypothetical protein TNCT_630121 [Trichonephila clavata]